MIIFRALRCSLCAIVIVGTSGCNLLEIATIQNNPAIPFITQKIGIPKNFSTNGSILAMAQLSDGSVILGGTFTAIYPQPAPTLLKTDLQGVVDTTFELGTGFDGTVYAVVQLSDGSILVGGNFNHFNGQNANYLVKLDSSGNLDTTFSSIAVPGGTWGGTVYSIVVSGSDIFIGGIFTTYGKSSAYYVAKINSSGVLDPTFNAAAWTTPTLRWYINSLVINGSSIYAGGFIGWWGSASTPINNIVKLDTTTGAADTTFSPKSGANGTDNIVNSLATDGSSLFLGGAFTTYRGTTTPGLAKINLSSGILDSGFSTTSAIGGGLQTVNSLALAGGSLFLGGNFLTIGGATANYVGKTNATSGTPDSTFNFPATDVAGTDGAVNSIQITGTNLYIGGAFLNYRGTPTPRIAKLDLSGNLDMTFSATANGNGLDATLQVISIGSSYLFLGGQFHTFLGTTVNHIAKLDREGNLDLTFSAPSTGLAANITGTNGNVYSLAILNDSIYAGGGFGTFKGAPANGIAKITSNGNLDTTFNPSTGQNGVNGTVYSLATAGNNVYAGGMFTKYQGLIANNIAKLDVNGNLDTAFCQQVATQGTNTKVSALAVSDSGIFAGGTFTTYGGSAANYIAKINTDGTLDTTFNPSTGGNGFDAAVVALNSTVTAGVTSIYASGAFLSYRGAPAIGVAKLSTIGSLDLVFDPSTGPNGLSGTITSMALYGDSLFVAGLLVSYRGYSVSNLVKLDLSTGQLNQAFNNQLLFSGPNLTVNSILPLDRSILLGGIFTAFGKYRANYFVPISLDGGIIY